MSSFKNVSSQGDLDLPLIGRVVAAGEVFDATADQAVLLSAQPNVWQLVTTKKEDSK